MAGRTGDLKCGICGRVFRLKSSFDVHMPIHKSNGVLQNKRVDSTIDTDTNCQSQGNTLKFLEKEDPPLSCELCGKHFSLPLGLKTHVIGCKAKSSFYSKTEDFSSENFSINVLTNVSDDEIEVYVNQLDSLSKDKKKAVNLFFTSESLPLKFSSHPVTSAKLTCAIKKNTEGKCTKLNRNVVTLKPVTLNDSHNFVKSVEKKIRRNIEHPSLPYGGDTVKKHCSSSKSKEKQQLETNERSYLCDICGKCFPNKSGISKHMKCHTKEFVCQKCNRKFISQYALAKHLTTTCSDESKTCKYCFSKFAHRVNALRHMQTCRLGETRDGKCQCEFCGKMLMKTSYSAHRRTHTGERPYCCEFCGASFGKRYTLKIHLIKHEDKKYQCDICHKGYVSKMSLDKHVLRHRAIKNEHGQIVLSNESKNCSHCGKNFPSITLLNLHEKTHRDSTKIQKHMPFECSSCGKRFICITHLKIHEMIHTGEKPFKCSFCDKKFRLRTSLVNHERIHTGERPFSCKECGKSFVQRAHLSTHLILHTGEKPYQCSYCNKGFADLGNLNAHTKLHLKK